MQRRAKMHDFEIGDEVVYNPQITPLPSARERKRDWGTVVYIDNNYIHIKHCDDGCCRGIHKVLPEAVSHFPRSWEQIKKRHKKMFSQALFSLKERKEPSL